VPSDAAGAARLRNGVVRLEKVHRHGGAIADLAAAVRDARPDVALTVLRNGDPGAEDGVELVEPRAERPTEADLADLRRDATAAGRALVEAAREGDAGAALRALDSHRLLLAHRSGPYGAARWASQVEAWIAEEAGLDRARGPWYVGRPLLVTANDRATGLFNGDTGVVVDDGAGGLVACFGDPDDPREVRPHRLPAVETVYATTIHRAQGSQFARVSVILPPVTSPLLTRELLYTAVTRATRRVRLIGPEPAIRAALVRQVRRASGLRAPG
jgi:exodeoxyribonuclease V alpha subunit